MAWRVMPTLLFTRPHDLPRIIVWAARTTARPIAMEVRLNLQSRLESLKDRHSALEVRIADEDHRPRPNGDALLKLKVEKLRLKEEITRIAAR